MSERIKILFLIQIPPPFHGASLRNYELYESINSKEEFETKIIPISLTENIDDLSSFSLKKIILSLKILYKLIYEMRVFKPDIVFFSFSPNGWAFLRDLLFAGILKLYSGKKVFIIREQLKNSYFKNKLLPLILKKVVLIVLSKRDKEKWRKRGAKEVLIIHDGIKIKVKDEEINKKEGTDFPIILFLSNLSKEKGVYIFLKSLSILKDKKYTFKAELVGAPVNISEEELSKKIKALKIEDRVSYHGFAKGEKRFEFYLKSDIFVFPTLKETFPGVILEAMQCALPVVSTKEGGIPDIIIDGETGFLVEKGNPSALAEKIEVLLKDKNLAKKMGEKGRERFLKNFTFDKTEEEFVKLFSSLVENNED